MTVGGLLRGREQDVATVLRHLSAGVRIVTLTGMPGVGRTTLARHVAARQDEVAPGSVVVVEGTEDAGGAVVAALADTGVQVLVVARSPLRLPGEQVVRVEPLPAVDVGLDAAGLLAAPAVQLFTDVADALGTPVASDRATLADVGHVCNRVGGVPLAIALAAARTPAFSPGAIRELLGTSTVQDVLSVRASDPPGPPDLFAAIAWSESLLDPEPRQLLRDLGTFRGPADVDSITAVVGRDDVVDDLTTLVDVHLLDAHHGSDAARFSLHPLVREHACAALGADAPERVSALRERHLTWAVGVADLAPAPRLGPYEADLVHALECASAAGRATDAATLVVGLAPLWLDRGTSSAHVRELRAVRDWVQQAGGSSLLPIVLGWLALFRAEAATTADDVAAVVAETDAALRAAGQGDVATRLRVLTLAVQAARVVDERAHLERLCAEGRSLAADAADERALVRFEIWSGMLAQQTGRVDEAAERGVTALARARSIDDPALLVAAAGFLRTLPPGHRAGVALPPGADLVDAARRAEDHRALAWLLPLAAMEALAAGDLAGAAGHDAELLLLAARSGQWPWCGAAYMNLTLVAAARGEDDRAARLHGMLEPHLPVLRNSLPPWVVEAYERSVQRVGRSLGSRFDPAVGRGAALGRAAAADEAAAYAVAVAGIAPEGRHDDDPLTARQHEILDRLVAGDSNKDISSHLGISPKTVMHHTSNIYRKLGVRGRAEAVAWAVRRAVHG